MRADVVYSVRFAQEGRCSAQEEVTGLQGERMNSTDALDRHGKAAPLPELLSRSHRITGRT